MADKIVQGAKIVYLTRLLSEASKSNGEVFAYTTENGLTISNEAESIKTKDGTVRVAGQAELELTLTAALSENGEKYRKYKKACIDGEAIEIWEANLQEPTSGNKYKGTYYQGYITSYEVSSSADGYAELSMTVSISGTGAEGEVTVSTQDIEKANYVFADSTKGVGA